MVKPEQISLARHSAIHRDQIIIEQMSPEQGNLLYDLLNADLEAIDAELKASGRLPLLKRRVKNPSVRRRRSFPHRYSSRTGKHPVRLWLPTSAHW